MAVSDTAKLIVDLSLKGNFVRQMGGATRSLDAFTKGESRAFKAGAQIGTGIRNAGRIAAVGIAAITSQVALGLDSLIKLEKATAQTEAVLASTGGVAGKTANDIAKLSEKYESMNALVGDEFIQAGQNMLLTFTNIRNKAFEPTLAAILDMNTALGKGPEGLTNTALQVGKALNDPAKGLLTLRRAGVQFTDAQVDKIKSLQKEGKLYEAQKIILAELNKEFGGSFAAQGDTTAGKVAKFGDAIEDLQRTLATALLPTVSNVADALSEFFADDSVKKGAEDLGREIGKLFSKENIKTGIDALKGAFNTAREVAPIVAAAVKTMGGVISTAVKAFKSLPPEIQNLAIAGFAVNKLTGGLVTNIGGGLIGAVLKQLKSAVVTVHGGVVNVSGPGLGGGTGIAGSAGAAGIGARALVAGGAAAAVVGLLQEASKEAAKAFNTEFSKIGVEANFQGAQFGPQGIIPALQNIAEAIRVAGEIKPPPPIVNVTVDNRGHEGAGFRPRPAGAPPDPFARPDRSDAVKAAIQNTTTAVETMRSKIGDSLSGVKSAVASAGIESAVAAKNAGDETKAAVAASSLVQAALLGSQLATTMTTASNTQGAVRNVAPPIVGAIRSNRPVVTTIVNVTATHVTKQTTILRRYGPGGGSAGQDQRSGPLEY